MEVTYKIFIPCCPKIIEVKCMYGIYSSKFAYSWLNDEKTVPLLPRYSWNWVWELKIPTNIQFFLWQVMHIAIPTWTILNHRVFPLDFICPICYNEPGTLVHCLFNCNHQSPPLANFWQKQLKASPNKEERQHETFSSIFTKRIFLLERYTKPRFLKDTKNIVLQSHQNL